MANAAAITIRIVARFVYVFFVIFAIMKGITILKKEKKKKKKSIKTHFKQ